MIDRCLHSASQFVLYRTDCDVVTLLYIAIDKIIKPTIIIQKKVKHTAKILKTLWEVLKEA